jgi:predicted transcriptional regulator
VIILTPFGFDFRTGKQGLEKVLGPLESEIMNLVWSKGRVTVREIYEALLANSDKSIAYTTVMTTMTRLAKKDILKAFKEGNAYSYEAAYPKEEFLSTVVGEVVDGLIDDFSEPAVAHFIEKIKSVDPVKLKQLEDLIRNQKKDEY